MTADLRLSIDTDPAEWAPFWAALDEPGVELDLTEREREVRDRVRSVVGAEVAPRAVRADVDHTFVHDSVQALAVAGLGGLLVPPDLGGTGDSHVSYALAVQEISMGCPATSLVYMTQLHAAYPIITDGTPELAARYVPGLVDASVYGSLAITEPEAGSDAASLRTRAVRQPDGTYRLSGSKTFISTGDRSGVIICFATVDPASGHRGITAFVVRGDAAGLRRGMPLHKMGMHGSTTTELFLDDVHVDADHVLDGEGRGWAVLMRAVVKSRVSAAAQGVGIARASYGRALAALRLLHGAKIPDELRLGLAGLRAEILQGQLLLLATARQIDRTGTASPGQVGMMKQACTDLGWSASVEAVRLLGSYGDHRSLGVERCLRDVRITQVYDGTNEVQRLLVARDTDMSERAMT
ncbi:acyl-CoA dehydrogenase family protein [Aeromicrobium wangtongii]|uniref:acyl-CoA dehydrogenase family protein n=1 Tax=Aeromicrobium wangtongii TaxID=2969247 RepID=UPI002016EDE8|nr:acyl-CoA dehydrogenase family protein [Aeromicrobium wangtongii]MCL3819387.1 acyl-CoA dehydrogenase family protein [Aeromicrobium wangtongii]